VTRPFVPGPALRTAGTPGGPLAGLTDAVLVALATALEASR
jgi:hypothetical protein